MIMIIALAVIIPLVIASVWGIYYTIKKSGKEKERLNNLEQVMKSVAKTETNVIKRRGDSLDTIRKRLRKYTRD